MQDMQEARVQSLGQEYSLGNGTHSSFLAWKIPWAEELGGLQSMGPQRATWLSYCTIYILFLVIFPLIFFLKLYFPKGNKLYFMFYIYIPFTIASLLYMWISTYDQSITSFTLSLMLMFLKVIKYRLFSVNSYHFEYFQVQKNFFLKAVRYVYDS